MYPVAEKRFIRISKITIVILFLVISAGGIVRSTGSGMGCPDWPKCFNRIIPPTDASQLPQGYEKHYVEGRVKKNLRFAKMVEFFGYPHLADQIRHDESILAHEEFNVAKTWTEYINRLAGVAAGFCLLFTVIFSFTYWKKKKAIVIWSVLNLIVVVIQAWLGSIVVSTNLTPWIITIHMLLALIIVCISIQIYHWAITYRQENIHVGYAKLKWLTLFSIVILVAQVIFGTEVRETIDFLNQQQIQRSNWIDSIGYYYDVHRLLAYLTFVVCIVLFYSIRKSLPSNSIQFKYGLISLVLVCAQMLTGIILARYQVPAVAQTFHLVLASLLVGAQYYLLLLLNPQKESLTSVG